MVHVSEMAMNPSIKILYNSANAAILGAVDKNKAADVEAKVGILGPLP